MDANDLRFAPAKFVQAVDHILDFRKKYDEWTTIKEIVKVWENLHEDEYQSYVIDSKDLRETRKKVNIGTSTFSGVSYDKTTGGYLQYHLDIPEKIILMIRRVYDVENLPFDKKFYKKFAKLFPQYKVMERSR